MAGSGLKPYSTLETICNAKIDVKRSIFFGCVAPAGTIAEAEAVIATIRKEHYSARHHCTAMILGDTADLQRSNDDGEPAGSAGAPMLSVLRHHGLTNVVAVVTRYFGGTLLGVGGLIRAYTDAVSLALAQATIVSYVPALGYELACGYAVLGDFEQVLRSWLANHHADLAAVSYDPGPKFSVLVAETAETDFVALLAPWLPRGVTSTVSAAGKLRVKS
ncbi:MAG: IMPACT family protein [Propionibacteriaceae bacterium]|jgi:uncharacterized YigZ family protein|nr:IMPACT family protein [Propionibacteriaceae bacterium]